MLSFMSDRRVLAVSAAFITAAIFLFLLGTFPSWKAAIGNGLSWPSEAPAMQQPGPDNTRKSEATPPPGAEKQAAGVQPSPSAGAAQPTPSKNTETVALAAQSPVNDAPSFDIVRVEPSGDSVIAARTKAGGTVVLLDQGHPIASAKADNNGQVAFVPPTLAPGEHSLMLSLGEPNAPGALSSQSVAVSVPERAKAPAMVALLQPDQPTKLLSGTTSPAAGGASAIPPVSVGAIDVEEMGSVFATGHATPGSQCRVYLNGSFVAGVNTGADGTWSLKIQHGMRPGHYSVRVDELASSAGDVRARAEVPFDYPARATASVSLLRPRRGQTALPVPAADAVSRAQWSGAERTAAAPPREANGGSIAPSGSASSSGIANDGSASVSPVVTQKPDLAAGIPTIVAQLLTTKVTHGDSLWRISRKMLGHGRRYTQIYAANTSQIRDPRLIYPGQIFVMPQTTP